jgi:hypothetical protein
MVEFVFLDPLPDLTQVFYSFFVLWKLGFQLTEGGVVRESPVVDRIVSQVFVQQFMIHGKIQDVIGYFGVVQTGAEHQAVG